MEIFYVLLVLLTLSKLLGEIVSRLSFPSILGEILAGVVLGIVINFKSEFFPMLSGIQENEVFHTLTDLGIFF